MNIRHIAVLALASFIVFQGSFQGTYAKSGAEKIEKTKKTSARLYISAVSYDDSVLTGVEFVWIPKSTEPECAGKSLKECQELDYERRVIRSSDDKKIPIGLKPWTGEIPSRVLTLWITEQDSLPESKSVLKTIRRLKFLQGTGNQAGHREYRYSLDVNRSIGAKVVWQQWSNGEGFRVQEISTR